MQILYVYQDSKQAWKFVQARKATEYRRIQPQDFVRQYFAVREVVNGLKAEFGKKIQVDLLMKNNDGSHRFYRAWCNRIDEVIPNVQWAFGIRVPRQKCNKNGFCDYVHVIHTIPLRYTLVRPLTAG